MRILTIPYSVKYADTYGMNETANQGGSQSLRRCPSCGKTLYTNLKGAFWCRCGFSDNQDVKRLKKGVGKEDDI